MLRKSEWVLSCMVIVGVALITLLTLTDSWSRYTRSCPIKDVLSWDENLRHITVLDQYQDLRQGRYLSAIRPILDLPTWPYLHQALFLTLSLFSPAGPSVELDIVIGTLFYAATFIILLIAAIRWSSPLTGSAIWAFSSLLLLEGKEFPAYSMSAMFETQGMFFLILTSITMFMLFSLTKEQTGQPAVETNKKKVPKDKNKTSVTLSFLQKIKSFRWKELKNMQDLKIKLLVLLSIQSLLHTKYPYAIIYSLTYFLFEFLISYSDFYKTFRFSLRKHYRGVRLALILVLVAIPLIYYIAQFVFGLNVRSRSIRTLMYLVLLLLFIDLNIFYFKNRPALKEILPYRFRIFYEWGALPAFAWMFIHPDRIRAAFWYQGIVTKQTTSFFASLFNDIYSSHWPIVIILLFTVAGVGLYFYKNIFYKKEKLAFNDLIKEIQLKAAYPLIAITLLTYLQIFVLEVMTSNHQIRYIYHLVPLVILLSGLWAYHSFRFLVNRYDSQHEIPGRKAGYALLFAVCIMVVSLLLSLKDGGVLTDRYFENRIFCFTGTDTERIEPARQMALSLSPDERYVLVNSFHHTESPLPGRALASEIDLLLRMRSIHAASSTGYVKTDSVYEIKNWDDFHYLLLVTEKCGEAKEALSVSSEEMTGNPLLSELYRRTVSLGVKLHKEENRSYGNGAYCMTRFRIEKR